MKKIWVLSRICHDRQCHVGFGFHAPRVTWPEVNAETPRVFESINLLKINIKSKI